MGSIVESVDSLNSSGDVAESFARQRPDETVLYAAAAIRVPGWSVSEGPSALARNFGIRRGTVLVTNSGIHFASGRISVMTLFWAGLFVFAVACGVIFRAWPMFLASLAPLLPLVQRVPTNREFPYAVVDAIELRELTDHLVPAYSLALRIGDKALRFNTNKQLDGPALEALGLHGLVSV